jgi:hypothetical protein
MDSTTTRKFYILFPSSNSYVFRLIKSNEDENIIVSWDVISYILFVVYFTTLLVSNLHSVQR